MAKCKRCRAGKHDDDCENLNCTCWCISEAVAFLPFVGKPPEPREDIAPVLALMRGAKMTSRTTKEHKVVYRPKPSTLDPELRQLIRLHSFDLTRVLVAYTNPQPRSRPLWTSGPTEACFGCKLSCVSIDPLGHPRHVSCGWLGQRSRIPPIRPAPLYPRMATGTAVWGKQ